MALVAAEDQCGVVLMHMQGAPLTMQQDPRYGDVIADLLAFFEERMAYATRQGIPEENIILDPGIGFGKTLDHNLTILRRLPELTRLGRPLLVGLSRKSFISQIGARSGLPPELRLEGSLAAGLWAVRQGARGLRVHDVAETRRALDVWGALAGAA
jgi:dihydropteroate synthase